MSKSLRFGFLLPAFTALALPGCSTLTGSLSSDLSHATAQSVVRALGEAAQSRNVHLTVVGDARLNPGRDGQSRPLRLCVYLVSRADWAVPEQGEDCTLPQRDADVLASAVQSVPPGKTEQLQLQGNGVREMWLVVHGQYAQRPARYAPLRLRVEGHGWIHLSAWARTDGLFDGRKTLPPLPDEAQARPASLMQQVDR